MNIEQLERGNKIIAQIKNLKISKEDLSKNYLQHVKNGKNDYGYANGLSISFREKECSSVVSFRLSDEELKEVYNLLDGFLDKKIRAAQKEFDEL